MFDDERCVGYGGFSGIWFALLVIFLVVLFVLFRRRETGLETLLPTALSFMNKKHGDGEFHDHRMTELLVKQAEDTGKIKKEIEEQSSDFERAICRVIENQNKCAHDAERIATQGIIAGMQEKLADKDRTILEEKAKTLQCETIAAVKAIESKHEHKFNHLEFLLNQLYGKTVINSGSCA